jgi:hypothetical protein
MEATMSHRTEITEEERRLIIQNCPSLQEPMNTTNALLHQMGLPQKPKPYMDPQTKNQLDTSAAMARNQAARERANAELATKAAMWRKPERQALD